MNFQFLSQHQEMLIKAKSERKNDDDFTQELDILADYFMGSLAAYCMANEIPEADSVYSLIQAAFKTMQGDSDYLQEVICDVQCRSDAGECNG